MFCFVQDSPLQTSMPPAGHCLVGSVFYAVTQTFFYLKFILIVSYHLTGLTGGHFAFRFSHQSFVSVLVSSILAISRPSHKLYITILTIVEEIFVKYFVRVL
jgi:hypothetical protein